MPSCTQLSKVFAEDFPECYLMAAGSLLAIYLSDHSFPVGKVEFCNLYPLSFSEFLKASGQNTLAEKLDSPHELVPLHELFTSELKKYFILGGMPQVLSTYFEKNDFSQARMVQETLLSTYKADFTKYSGPVNALKILSVFENIPRQLAKDNSKFQFNFLKTGSRYFDFSSAIDWLDKAGLCYKIPIIEHVELPLSLHVKENIFKLYFFDIGHLGALADLPLSSFVNGTERFKTFKGASIAGKAKHLKSIFFMLRTLTLFLVFAEKYHPKWKIRASLHPLYAISLL